MPCSICRETGHNILTCPNIKNIIHTTTPDDHTEKNTAINTSIEIKYVTNIPLPKPPSMCVICLEEITTQPKTTLTCSHEYCTECIMRNISLGNTSCAVCRDVVVDPNTEMKDLKQQITNLESLYGREHETATRVSRELQMVVNQLTSINVGSTDQLRDFICSYKIMKNIISENCRATGMSLLEFINMHQPDTIPNANANANANTNIAVTEVSV
jgi:hypothetical protein